MKAVVVKSFPGRPDNEAASRTIAVREIITGELADVAVENGWAEEVADDFEWPLDDDGKPILPSDEEIQAAAGGPKKKSRRRQAEDEDV